MSRVDHGTVTLKIDGTEHTMKPTLRAMQKIQARWPDTGLNGAISAAQGMLPDNLAYIVAAAAGVGQREAKELPEAVFQEGVARVAPKVIEFLVLLMNPTGKDSEPEEDADEEDPDEGE